MDTKQVWQHPQKAQNRCKTYSSLLEVVEQWDTTHSARSDFLDIIALESYRKYTIKQILELLVVI